MQVSAGVAPELIGYRCFGADGRVPGGSYDDSALDTAGGLRPSLTGRGLGRRAIQVGLDYGRERYRPRAFRVTVASFNERALRVVRSLGFAPTTRFTATTNGRSYQILVRAERRGAGISGRPTTGRLRRIRARMRLSRRAESRGPGDGGPLHGVGRRRGPRPAERFARRRWRQRPAGPRRRQDAGGSARDRAAPPGAPTPGRARSPARRRRSRASRSIRGIGLSGTDPEPRSPANIAAKRKPYVRLVMLPATVQPRRGG